MYDLDDLRQLMRRLRDPQDGCPWDLKQDYRTITPHTLEEVYEVVDTIERGDYDHLREELGDLLFQIVFYVQLAEEEERFGFADVVDGIVRKLLRRHPHVFPDGSLASRRDGSAAPEDDAIRETWEALKQEEREDKGHRGLLADIPVALPALTRAQKVQKRAAKVGFDWPDATGVLAKIREEMAELEAELETASSSRIEDELGDLMFSCVNLSRHLGCDVEQTLRRATAKFESRFAAMEALAASQGENFEQLSPDDKEQLWARAKTL